MKILKEEILRNGEKLKEAERLIQSIEKVSKKRARGREADTNIYCKRVKKTRRNKQKEEDVCLIAKQEVDKDNETGGNDRKVKVANLPVPALEKVFSYLDWKGLGRAMLVCKRWYEVGGHPSLWTEFPLQLSGLRRLKRCSKVRRLSWVKSATISFQKETNQHRYDVWQTLKREFTKYAARDQVLIPLTRVEELIFLDPESVISVEDLKDIFYIYLLVKGKLVRICAIGSPLNSANKYFVANCDAGTNKFIKKTVEKNACPQRWTLSFDGKGRPITIYGPPGVQFSNEVLETIFTIYDYPIALITSLVIGQNIDLTKLKYLLSHYVAGYVDWTMNAVDLEKQEVGPIDTILDQLARWAHWEGGLEKVTFPTELVLKSHWLDKLGGREKVEANSEASGLGIVSIDSKRSGLRLVEYDEGGNEIVEDEDDEEEDNEGEEEEEDEEEEEEDGDDEKEYDELEVDEPGEENMMIRHLEG